MSNNQMGRALRLGFASLALCAAATCPLATAREGASYGYGSGCGPSGGGPDCIPVRTRGAVAVDVAFSPGPAAEELVIKAIDSAREGGSIRLMAYSFTSAPIVRALLNAHRARHVDVQLVVDHKANVSEDKSGKARAALGALAAAGVPIRTVSAFAIAHDKVLVIDSRTVQTGSFNYTSAAAKRNSENVIVEWDNSQLAAHFLRHWQRNWDLGHSWREPF
jgi:phosphatidylserine/phosphatidylglycerophosphate/cardiolipin synthase-like enzyme